MSDIEQLTTRALAEIGSAHDLDALESLRVGLLGKSGSITGQLKQLGALPPPERALFLFTRTCALGHRAFADDAGIGGLEAADPLGGERAFTRELVSAGAFGEEVGERAIGLAVRVEESEDAVETIPIIGDANEAAAVRLQAIADHVGERQAAFAE